MLYIGKSPKTKKLLKKVNKYRKWLKSEYASYYARHPRYMSDDTRAGYFENENSFGWVTCGGNKTAFSITDKEITLTLAGARQGVRYPDFIKNIAWETVQYKTWEPSWSPWESILDHPECINMADSPYEYSLETEEYLYDLERSFFAA